jgi:hypothetical protein
MNPVFVRIERVLEVKVPDHIDLQGLANVYRLDGIQLGMKTLEVLPEKFREAVIQGKIPRQVDTIKFIGAFRRAIVDNLIQVMNQAEAVKHELEKTVGFQADPVSAKDLMPDMFIRVVRIPDVNGGGFYAEMDSEIHGRGLTMIAALKDLISKAVPDEATSIENP